VATGTTLLGVDTQESLEAVLRHAFAQQTPDVIIASGDLAHDPFPHIYARFATTLSEVAEQFGVSEPALLCTPGNHDLLEPMQAAGLPLSPLEIQDWTLVPLDSHEDDAPRANIDERTKAEVQAGLESAQGAHVLVATHHHPVAVDCPWLDVDGIQKSSDLVHWLAECNPRLRGLIFGHVHQEVTAECGQDPVLIPVWGTPSTCFQFQPMSAHFTLADAAPGYRWLYLAEDGRIETRVERVTDYVMNPVLPPHLS